jgi:NADH:ubiquinone oxidoreductase subunit F (NADH-binding)/(2Fe-2S) ferredoxin
MQTIIEKYQRIREQAANRMAAAYSGDNVQILIGLGTCGIAAGGRATLAALEEKLAQEGVEADIVQVGCIGMCFNEPLVDIVKPGRPRICYSSVTPEMVRELVDDYVLGDNPRPDLAIATIDDEPFSGIPSWNDMPFYKGQIRRVLQNCGFVDPEKVDNYVAQGGYYALAKALAEMSPKEIIEIVRKSGLRGRGGAGFPTGLKWDFTYTARGQPKYVVCNFDEGDPGAFMNRSEVEGDPHRLLEGMVIAAYAVGANQGFIYGRAEYPLALERLRKAIAQAEKMGVLGDDILGSGFSFRITLKEGAGAFVCGEETALMASIEGRRGMPRSRPPFPAQSGLWGRPTLINNVGTLFNISNIIGNGADWFAEVGTERSKGTKVFSLVGQVTNSGLVEVPLGTPLRDIIFGIGGGVPEGRTFKAVQTGGPSGGCLPANLLDLSVDYESLAQAGSIVGSGGMVVMNEDTCMVDIARFFLSFTQSESCGKCVPCRLGTRRMLETLERITYGEGKEEDIDLLLELADTIKNASMCGLGQTSPNPVLTTIRYFRDEYKAHINENRCPAHVCKSMVTYRILSDKCVGCTVCVRNCPVNAISGERKKVHVIDSDLCTRCDTCRQVCKFDAVVME